MTQSEFLSRFPITCNTTNFAGEEEYSVFHIVTGFPPLTCYVVALLSSLPRMSLEVKIPGMLPEKRKKLRGEKLMAEFDQNQP